MISSQPQPQSESLFFEKKPLPHPLPPPQQESKRIIQIMELHPHPLLEVVVVPHPHPLAVKSLIISCLQRLFVLWFILCETACMCLQNMENIFIFFMYHIWIKDLN